MINQSNIPDNLLNDLMKAFLDNEELNEKEKSVAVANIQTITAQGNSKEPNKGIISKSIDKLKEIAEGAKAAKELMPLVMKLFDYVKDLLK